MALVDQQNPGGGILVDSKAVGRPVGDTSGSAVYVTDLPKNFHGGDESLHFALGELFGQYGKIKKIELYMEKGIHDTENFKGDALVVYHPSKHTGTHDKGDPVYEACTDLDGRTRILGKRHWRIRCETAVWQKEGFDVKSKAKLHPCVELANLWDYDPNLPLSWFMEIQEVIRKHAAEHIESPFVKVEPSLGTATVWCKGARDAMTFASLMQKTFFMGRKVVSQLARKERPLVENMPKIPLGELSMKVPGVISPVPGMAPVPVPILTPATPASTQAPASEEPPPTVPLPEPSFLLREGCLVKLTGLVAKPENNGRKAKVVGYLGDIQKYQVKLEDGRVVKVKPENIQVVQEKRPIDPVLKEEEIDEPDEATAEAEVAAAIESAQAAAAQMAEGKMGHGPPQDPADVFTPTVCVDPSLLPKKETDEEAAPPPKRDRSRSRERRQEERIAAAKARLEADKSGRPGWIVPSPQEIAAKAAAAGGGGAAGIKKQPEESREELMKMSVSKLKELLKEYGKTPRGCLEKKDFVDRLKPAPA